MNVASLDACKELHELSGWNPHEWVYDTSYVDNWLRDISDFAHTTREWLGVNTIPAYDLGYLLRRLPKWIDDEDGDDDRSYPFIMEHKRAGYYDEQTSGYVDDLNCSADTPEDAAAKLAIELFKQGILKKEDIA